MNMTWSEFLAAQLDRARAIALHVTEDFDDDDFYTRVERVNPGIWILGHMANSAPSLVFNTLNEPLPLPENWGDWFRIGTKVLDDLHAYPPLAEIRRVLDDSHQQTLQRIRKLSDDDLLAPVSPKMQIFQWMKTIRDAVGFAAIHESNHSGQLMLLRRLLGKPGLI
jgi:hypothetical protein